MDIVAAAFIFFFGASVGSFVNVIAMRHGTGLSPWKGSSKCFACGSDLRWYELVPLFSYLWQKGRCRHCSAKLSAAYFLAEIFSGFSAVFLYQWSHSFLELALLFLLAEVLLAIFIYDIRHKIIPDTFLSVFAVLSLIFSYFILHAPVLGVVKAALIVPLPFFIIWLASSGRYIGFGDVKYMAVMGLLFGWREGLSAVLISFWIGFVYVSFAFLTRLAFKLFHLRGRGKPLTMKSELPFAPFLVIGTLLGLFLNIDLISNALVQ